MKLQTDPMVLLPGIVVQENRSAPVVGHKHIVAPVVVIVADREAPRGKCAGECRPRLVADVAQAGPVVSKQQRGLLVLHGAGIVLDHVVRMPVGEKQIDAAVIVEVKEFQAPSAQQPRGLSQAVLVGNVGKSFVFVVCVQ